MTSATTGNVPTFGDTTGVTPAELAPLEVPADNIPSPVYPEPVELSTDDKIHYLFETATKVRDLLDKVTETDIEKVKNIAGNPIFARMFGKR